MDDGNKPAKRKFLSRGAFTCQHRVSLFASSCSLRWRPPRITLSGFNSWRLETKLHLLAQWQNNYHVVKTGSRHPWDERSHKYLIDKQARKRHMFRLPRRKRNQSDGTGNTGTIDINASADAVWRLLLDVDSYDKLFSSCHSVKNLTPKKSLNPVVPGARFLETRSFLRRRVSTANNVTVVDHERHELALATTFNYCTATSTMHVEALDDVGCRLSLAYCMVPDGWRGNIFLWMFKKALKKEGTDEIASSFQDIKYAAETGKYQSEKDTTDCNTSSRSGDARRLDESKTELA